MCLLVGIGAAAALLLIAVRALTVAASDDAEATEAVVEGYRRKRGALDGVSWV